MDFKTTCWPVKILRLKNNEVNLMFFREIPSRNIGCLFSFYKKFSSSFTLNPSFLHLYYCCICKILTKLPQPTVPGLAPPLSPVLSPETTLPHIHLIQLSPHPLWFCIDTIICFLHHSVLLLNPFILKLYYLLTPQTIHSIKSCIALSFNAPLHFTGWRSFSKTRLSAAL